MSEQLSNALDELSQHIQDHANGTRFLVCGFCITDDGAVHLKRVTSNFPTGQFGECTRLLDSDLTAELDKINLQGTQPKPASSALERPSLFQPRN